MHIDDMKPQETREEIEARLEQIEHYMSSIDLSTKDDPIPPHANMEFAYDEDLNANVETTFIPEVQPQQIQIKKTGTYLIKGETLIVDEPVAVRNSVLIDGVKYLKGRDCLARAIDGINFGNISLKEVVNYLHAASELLKG